LSSIIIGDVPPPLRETVTDDCERAFASRLNSLHGARLKPKKNKRMLTHIFCCRSSSLLP
jgi:hypothetical protein